MPADDPFQPVHHIELWTHDLPAAVDSFDWLLTTLGWSSTPDTDWPAGRTWHHPSGVYLVLEQSPAVQGDAHERRRPGLDHLALRAPASPDPRGALDGLREAAGRHGWSEMFAESYPHAGRPQHTALFLENDQGFEMEIVAMKERAAS